MPTDIAVAIRTLGTSDMEAMGIDPHRGPLDDWRAMRERNGCSVAESLKLGKGRAVNEIAPLREPLDYMQRYDQRQEALGWYRTARAAEILGMNPLWLAFASECGLVKTSHGYGRGGEAQRIRVRLEDARAWQALRLAENNGRPRQM